MKLAGEDGLPEGGKLVRVALLGAWAAIVLVMASRHVFWRDEVRAFSLALQGDNVVDMLKGLHGEGHPALWYLLLRGAHVLAPVREVLPAVSLAVAAAAMALLLFRSPFRPWLLALILLGGFSLFEYSVIARNYGISMLLLFAIAHLYPRHRDKGVALGLLLALLCNTNVPSALLAAAFLLFWLVDLVGEEGLRWGRRHWLLLLNGAIAGIGALLCFLTVYPTVHDAAQVEVAAATPGHVARALMIPADSFWLLLPPHIPPAGAVKTALSLILLGSLLGLVRAPGALLSSLLALVGFELFFQLVYPGSYRHQALLIVYLIAMYWLVARGHGGLWPAQWRLDGRLGPAAAAGRWLFVILLAIQAVKSADPILQEVRGTPHSRARDLGRLLAREHLRDATVVGDPEILLESLPYYAPNPIYLMRERRFGKVVRFTRHARTSLSLDDILADARSLRARTGRPVVIAIKHPLDPARPFHIREAYVWDFSTDPGQVRRFRAATRLLADFAPAVTDESYDVYLLTG